MSALSETLVEMKALKCPTCGAPYEDGGWGEDEYGMHQILICPNAQSHKNDESGKMELKPVEISAPLKLDLGCGKNKRAGFIGVDALKFDGVDQIINLAQRHELPRMDISEAPRFAEAFVSWPWKDGSVDEVHSSHFVEHLTQDERVHFFNELYRILRVGAQASIIVPSWSSERAYGDPTHKWPPVVGFSFFYLCKSWRDVNAPHVGYTCDFDFQGGNNLAHPWQLKNQEAQMFAQNHYLNVATDTFVTLTKTKRG